MITDIDYLSERISLGVNYLINNINADGSFSYKINARTGVASKKYNILRHSGTVYEVCLWLKQNPNNNILTKIQHPIDYLLKRVRRFNNTSCIVENGVATSVTLPAGNGFPEWAFNSPSTSSDCSG